MNVYSAIVAAIAIWAVVRITQHWLEARSRAAANADRKQGEIEDLEARVRTLERIVTDRREQLDRKFDDL